MAEQEIPKGYCQCGCGGKTTIAKQKLTRLGHIKGQPIRYIRGHNKAIVGMEHELEATYRLDKVSGCWVWLKAKSKNGYGHLSVNGKTVSAHRHFYNKYVGHIPGGMHIDHLCRNRACVNPAHLEVVTPTENVRRQSNVKLTMDEASEIRLWDNVAGVSKSDIARAYNVAPSLISVIVSGKVWR